MQLGDRGVNYMGQADWDWSDLWLVPAVSDRVDSSITDVEITLADQLFQMWEAWREMAQMIDDTWEINWDEL